MPEESKLVQLIVREIHESEEASRREIVQGATKELRATYGPRGDNSQCGGVPSEVLVALRGSTLVGTAEYIRKANRIYVQGVAVHREYRQMGVCHALLRKVEKIAKENELAIVALCAIEETGNVEIFKKLGFKVTSRGVAPNHVSRNEGAVTRVDMERRVT